MCWQGLLKDQLEIVKVKVNGKIKYAIQPLEEQLSFDKVGSSTRGAWQQHLYSPNQKAQHIVCNNTGIFRLHSRRADSHRLQPWRYSGTLLVAPDQCVAGDCHNHTPVNVQFPSKSLLCLQCMLDSCCPSAGRAGWSFWIWQDHLF